MSLLTLTFFIPPIRTCRIKTRAVTDPTQYDVEINTARGFKLHTPVKTKTKTKESPIDPAQFDTEENVVRHMNYKKD
jgi:hypothetical protein